MEFPFDAPALPAQRKLQAERWRQWWAGVPADRPPDEVLALLGPRRSRSLAYGAKVTVSTQYKGEPGDLVDGTTEGGAFWQTKNVPFPQWCQLDLGRPLEIAQAVVYQYGPEFCMTDCELAVSLDGEQFDVVTRHKGATPVVWAVGFPARQARYVRITSFDTVRRIYPTTFYEIEVYAPGAELTIQPAPADERAWLEERGARACGALGGNGAAAAVLNLLEPEPSAAPRDRVAVRTAIRAWGDCGMRRDSRNCWPCSTGRCGLEMRPMRWASTATGAPCRTCWPPTPGTPGELDGTDPPEVPADDRMGFPSEDRMLETPYSIAMALCRLPLDAPEDQQTLRRLAPQIMANLPSDYDSYVVYEPEVYHRLTRHLVEQAGLRRDAIEHAFERLGQPRRAAAVYDAESWPVFPARRMATWLPALCCDDARRSAASGRPTPTRQRLGADLRRQGAGLDRRPACDRAAGESAGRIQVRSRLRLQRTLQGRGVQRSLPALARSDRSRPGAIGRRRAHTADRRRAERRAVRAGSAARSGASPGRIGRPGGAGGAAGIRLAASILERPQRGPRCAGTSRCAG